MYMYTYTGISMSQAMWTFMDIMWYCILSSCGRSNLTKMQSFLLFPPCFFSSAFPRLRKMSFHHLSRAVTNPKGTHHQLRWTEPVIALHTLASPDTTCCSGVFSSFLCVCSHFTLPRGLFPSSACCFLSISTDVSESLLKCFYTKGGM